MIPLRAVKFAAALSLALAAAACSNQDAITGTAGLGGVGAGAGAAAPGSTQEFALSIGDRVFFDSDSTDLNPQAVATLDKQAQWLQRYSRYTFLVEGHADERGTREYNFSLSGRRSQVVRDYLASRGIDPARIRSVSYGKERPVAVCNDISCWSQNRRAVTVLDGASGA
jgi:peptidoglycan-associated lipoprotein